MEISHLFRFTLKERLGRIAAEFSKLLVKSTLQDVGIVEFLKNISIFLYLKSPLQKDPATLKNIHYFQSIFNNEKEHLIFYYVCYFSCRIDTVNLLSALH